VLHGLKKRKYDTIGNRRKYDKRILYDRSNEGLHKRRKGKQLLKRMILAHIHIIWLIIFRLNKKSSNLLSWFLNQKHTPTGK
jgi:hypothetical protein